MGFHESNIEISLTVAYVFSQAHCILMRLMVGRVKLCLSVLYSSWLIVLVYSQGSINDFAKSYHNLTYQTDVGRV